MGWIARPVKERLLDKVSRDPKTGCWLFSGHIMSNGYGQIRSDGGRKGRTMLAHRAAYESFKGPVPDGTELDHKCRVPHCVNPDHLEPVTHRENILRGIGPAKARLQQLAIMQCPQGHPYSPENTAVRRGARNCRACDRERAARKRERKRQGH